MHIDPTIIAILEARGLRRRTIAVALREVSGYVRFTNGGYLLGEAIDMLCGTLGSRCFINTNGETNYDIPIGRGVRLVKTSSVNNGFSMNPPATRHGTRIVIEGELPITIITALTGGPLKRLVDHPLLPGETTILDIDSADGETAAWIYPDERHISIIIPARRLDIDLEHVAWRLKRFRDARKAGALEGPSIKSIGRGLLGAMLCGAGASAVPIICGLQAPVTAAIVGIAAALGGLAIYAIAASWEDEQLEPRIDEMRAVARDARRESILAGNDS